MACKVRRGNIFPDQIFELVGAPIYFALGSLTPGKEWASVREHRELWLTKGEDNPDPRRFTEKALRFRDMSLLHLLQIGTDGSAGYQMLNLSMSGEIKYLLMYGSTEIEFASRSFRDGISRMTDWHIQDIG